MYLGDPVSSYDQIPFRKRPFLTHISPIIEKLMTVSEEDIYRLSEFRES